MKTKTLLDQLVESKFGFEFIRVLIPLTTSHMKICLDSGNIDYYNIGNEKEKKIKEIARLYGLLQTSVSDLELVLAFLKISNRNQIMELYPNLESQKQYFKYHFENFIIRIITITDIVGKLGNSIFETGIIEKKCNGYKFKEKIESTDKNCSILIEKLLVATKEIKEKRHQKLHSGESLIGYFEEIVFWDELSKITRSETSSLLDELTDNSIEDEIESLEMDIREIIAIVVEFTDYATDKFTEIANR